MKTRTKPLLIYDWMCDLGLTDKQQKLYALIYGYSQDGMSRMTGTARSIAAWLGCKERNAQYLLRQLEDMGLIRHCVVRTVRRTWTEFWAVLPEDAVRPEKGTKEKIGWADNAKFCVTDYAENCAMGYAKDCVTDKVSIYSRDRYKKNTGGGKNSAPGRANTTTTTTGFLFEDIELPFRGEKFVEVFDDAWAKLRRQPKWAGKTPEALQIVLERLAYTNDPLQAAWCCLKAVEKGWDTIKDPFQMYTDDADEADAFFELQKELAK